MSSFPVVKKVNHFANKTSANFWKQLDQWENLCCPQRTTVRLVFLFLFFLLLELTVFVLTLLHIPARIETGSYFLNNGVPLILLIGTTGSVVKLSHMLTQRARMGAISSTLRLFDQKLQRLDFRMHCEEIRYWTVGWSATFVITLMMFSVAIRIFASVMFSHSNTIMLIAFINVANTPYSIFTVWFMICELTVWCRLKLLHSLLGEGMRAVGTSGRKLVKNRSVLVAGVADLHNTLSTVVGHINAVFAVQVPVCLAAYTILLIFCLFSYYRAAVAPGEVETNFAWLIVSWSLYNSCFLLPKICFGALVRKSAHLLVKSVLHSLRNASDVALQNQILIFSQQLEHDTLEVGNKMFTVDWHVYASIIGYISTYVVILIQFDSKSMEMSKIDRPLAQTE